MLSTNSVLQAGDLCTFVSTCMDTCLALHTTKPLPHLALQELAAPPTPDKLAATAARLAANLCTNTSSAPPLARSSSLAACTITLAALHPPHRCPIAGLHLITLICNASFYSRVSILPDLEHPHAGGNAFLALPLDSVLDVVLPGVSCDDPDVAEAAASVIANFAQLPELQDRRPALRVGQELVPLIVSAPYVVATAAAGALTNIARRPQGCLHLTDVPIGPPLLQALRARLHSACSALKAGDKAPVAAAAALLHLLQNFLRWHDGAPGRRHTLENSNRSHKSSGFFAHTQGTKFAELTEQFDCNNLGTRCFYSNLEIEKEAGKDNQNQNACRDAGNVTEQLDDGSDQQSNTACSHSALSMGSRASSCGSEDVLESVCLGEGFWDGASALLSDLDNAHSNFTGHPMLLGLLGETHAALAALTEHNVSEPGAAHS
jgi:hypothetical protein